MRECTEASRCILPSAEADLSWPEPDGSFAFVRGFSPSVGEPAQGGARLAGRTEPDGVCGCLDEVGAAGCGRDTGVAVGNGGCGRRCGSGGGGGGPIPGGFAWWGVSGVAEAPPPEPAEAESASGEHFASLAFWASRALLASRAFFSSSPRLKTSSTTVGGRG